MTSATLVSIVMPTYKPRYFAQALDSVLAQTYPALELVICDDNGDGAIESILLPRLASAPFPIRYHRNPMRLGELGSTINGIGLAQGEYVKFLHDDDVLEPDCIAQLVEAIERTPARRWLPRGVSASTTMARRCRTSWPPAFRSTKTY